MISAIIITKNEEKNIKKCIQSVKWCDEILVIDSRSTDDTVGIAKKMGATVIVNEFENDFSKQRNIGLDKAQNDWVFYLDADERVSEGLAYEINNKITQNLENYEGFYVPRIDVMWEKQLHFGESQKRFIRLGKKGIGRWKGTVHEQWKMKGKVGTLQNMILHYPHQSIDEFLKEVNFYTDLRAKELYEQRKKSGTVQIITYPTAKFIENYIVRMGIRDGVAGMIVAIMMSFHSFLVRGKLFLLQNKSS